MRDVLAASLIAMVFAGFGPGARAQSHDPTVTSDTTEYCGILISRLTGLTRASARPLPTDVALLSEEGERMCGQGQIRGGILRLRRALILLQGNETYNSIAH